MQRESKAHPSVVLPPALDVVLGLNAHGTEFRGREHAQEGTLVGVVPTLLARVPDDDHVIAAAFGRLPHVQRHGLQRVQKSVPVPELAHIPIAGPVHDLGAVRRVCDDQVVLTEQGGEVGARGVHAEFHAGTLPLQAGFEALVVRGGAQVAAGRLQAQAHGNVQAGAAAHDRVEQAAGTGLLEEPPVHARRAVTPVGAVPALAAFWKGKN